VTRIPSDTVHSLDDLELELRKLPGVRAAGFQEHEEMLLVQLHVAPTDEVLEQPIPVAASRIAARHSHRPVTVEIVRWREAPMAGLRTPFASTPMGVPADVAARERRASSGEPRRARLLAVLAFPDTDELEVHLIYEGKRTIGRAAASHGLVGAVDATIDAIRELGAPFATRARWARALDETDDDRAVVAVALEGADEGMSPLQYGLAAGASPIDAAARSTLDALNRRLGRVL
jgi:hypothetical protein